MPYNVTSTVRYAPSLILGPGAVGRPAVAVGGRRGRARVSRARRLRGERLEPRRLRHGLLREEARGGEHREPAVLQLLGLHLAEAGLVLGLEAERVEAEVARVVARLEALHL